MTRLELPDVTLVAAAALALALQAVLGGQPIFLPAILALIVLFGMPHGGLDIVLARRLWPIRSLGRLSLFLALYLVLAALVVAVWMISPTVALAIFLAYSAWHFSDDWAPGAYGAGGVAGGVLVLALPAVTDPERTGALFSALGASGADVAGVLALAGFPAAVLFVLASIREPGASIREPRAKALLRMAFLLGCSVVLTPLAYFFVFFCGLHAVQHMRSVRRALALGWRDCARQMLWPTLMAVALLCIAGLLLAMREVHVDEAMMRSVFVTFAALTVPHMLLVDCFQRHEEARSASE